MKVLFDTNILIALEKPGEILPEPLAEMVRLAEDYDIVVMKTAYRAYEACGKLYTSGLVAREPQG